MLIPLRLGLGRKVEPMYVQMLSNLFRDRCCLGIFGGRPKHSLYFAGATGQRFLYYDPHTCQPTVDVMGSDTFPVEVGCYHVRAWSYQHRSLLIGINVHLCVCFSISGALNNKRHLMIYFIAMLKFV